MARSSRPAGFDGVNTPVASSRLSQAVAATLAISALSLCVIVLITAASIKTSIAMPILAG